MAVTYQEVAELYVATFNRAPDATGLDYWVNDSFDGDPKIELIADSFFDQAETQALYPEGTTDEEFVSAIYMNLFGRAPDADGLAYWTGEDGLGGTMSRSQMILAVENGAIGADAEMIANKADVALYYAKDLGLEGTDFSLAGVTADPQTVIDAKAAADAYVPVDPGLPRDPFVLTQRADDLTGTDGDDLFRAPVTQNETGSGQLANTFETGDVLGGGPGGRDVLRADLIETGTIQDWVASAPISATTTGIEEVYLRSQMPDVQNTIDAEKMQGVEQWWTDNSRADINIEDIRSATAETTFGMRETDPGVSFRNFFNARYLEGAVDDGSTSFSFVIAETGNAAAQIENINVFAINFDYEGNNYALNSADVKAANTWAELQTALQAQIDATPALEGLQVAHIGGGAFNVVDASAGVFTIDPSGTVVTSSTVNETKSAAPGRVDAEEGPTVTDVILDGAGNGSQGGTLNIGAMSGLRGVEVFNVDVDYDSHLTSMTSYNQTPGQYNALRNGGVNEFLEVVNLTSIGAEGDLTIGRSTPSLDNRVAIWGDQDGDGVADGDRIALNDNLGNSGLLNVLEFNTENFNGAVNVAFTLDNNAIARYLDAAEDVVTFTYNGGSMNDIFNISDISNLGVSGDQDFALKVDMGAGDDRLIINIPTARAVSVDGGTGENSIVVSQSHGTNPNNTFAAFDNFQTYEVEGIINTIHDFTNMPGVESVVIATGTSIPPVAGGNTQLIDLEAAQDVTITGKNQTIGNQSTANQIFGTIRLTNDAGVDRTVTLDNTARLSNAADGVTPQDGILSVANLTINNNLAGVSATRNVTIDSSGARNVANAVNAFQGRDVETLKLTGSQELTFNVAQIADQAAAAGVSTSTVLDINASGLTGDLNLAVAGGMIGNWGTSTGLQDSIVGTGGDNDTLMVYGVQGNTDVSVTGFETIQFGSANTTLFGDWVTTQNASGIFDAQKVVANNFVISDDVLGVAVLQLNNLGNGKTVNMGDANTTVNGTTVNNQLMDDTITLNSGAAAGTPAAELTVNYLSNLQDGQTHVLNIGTVVAGPGNDTNGYQTINIDMAHAGNLTGAGGVSTGVDARTLMLTLTEDARVLNLTGGADNNDGIVARDTMAFGVGVGVNLPNSLTKIDLSGYEGDVTLTMEQGGISALAETDVRFIMSEDDATITLSNMDGSIGGAAGVNHNSIFEFTAANTTADVSTWTITNAIGAGQAAATIDNYTRFDVSDLGITSFDQIVIDTGFDANGIPLGTDLSIRSEAQDDASLTTGVNQNTWEIQLTGLTGALVATDITADNFIFA